MKLDEDVKVLILPVSFVDILLLCDIYRVAQNIVSHYQIINKS